MIIHDGKKIEISIGGISKSQLEKILQEHGKNIIDVLGKKLSESKIEHIFHNDQDNKEEKEIKINSLDKIADVMTTQVDNKENNFDNKMGNIKTTKKDVSKTIDILKNID